MPDIKLPDGKIIHFKNNISGLGLAKKIEPIIVGGILENRI